MNRIERQSLYSDVTNRIISELEQGRLPWVQSWDASACICAMPANARSGRCYSGINILLLWASAVASGYTRQRWLTYKQAEQAGGRVRRGEKGTMVCYADRFTPRHERETARREDRDARSIAFLKRFVVFNIDQCDDLPDDMMQDMGFSGPVLPIARADRIIGACGANLRIGGSKAFYAPDLDYVQVPPQAAFHEPVNWYRTALHELGHWTGHSTRLARDQTGAFGSAAYGREELAAELASAFACASLGITPTVRHADYIGAWLEILRGDDRAIFRAASAASKACDFLLAFEEEAA